MIIFTSAFYDIGRSDISGYSRKPSKYIEHFNNMISDGFDYTLVVYSHSDVLREILKSRSYPPNIMFIDISGIDTFLKEPYLSKETEIMANPIYKSKIGDFRKTAIEHTFPKYTLLTHSKICFLKHTKSILPNFQFYAWIDFGYPVKDNIFGWPSCPYPAVPKKINFGYLDEKFHIASYRIFPDHVKETDFLLYNCWTFYAFSFIIHSNILEIFFELYVKKLEFWQKNYLADDEQNLLYQIFQDHPNLFKVFHIGQSIWGLYHDNLNEGACPKILHQ